MQNIQRRQRFEALVVESVHQFVVVRLESKETLRVAKGEFHDLVPGDRVMIVVEDGIARIDERLERKSLIARMNGDATRKSHDTGLASAIVANVDLGVIVASAEKPTFHPRFIDRYLLLLELGSIQPVICITKSDLTSRHDEAMTLYGTLSIPVVEVSTVTGDGMEELKAILREKTAVFVGQSGVGKSSLVRALIPDSEVVTQSVSEKTGTGRHTTTTSGLYEWESHSMIIDTPGIRTLTIDHIPKHELRLLFREFDAFSDSCKFRDCIHMNEPNCAVKRGVEEGEIVRARYGSYVRMMEE